MEIKGLSQTSNTQPTLVPTSAPNPNRTRHSAFFRPPRLSNQKLNSTLQFDRTHSSQKKTRKFKQVDKISWKKWVAKGFPTLPPQFKVTLQHKAQKETQEVGTALKPEEIRLRNQLYELQKMRGDVERARENNRLITMIEQVRSARIECFFQKVQTEIYGQS